ncbi:MAG: threonine--tRNA ligase [Candidatus Pacebacteria bacterium]|nr:threonine--tRNA ligase [Candidatus Paceibacterota bacterium]
MENNKEQLEKIRHSLAHLLASAVLKIDPEAKLAIGPAVENGFYYDFDLSKKFEEKNLRKLEKEMRKLISQKLDFIKEEISKPEAKKLFTDQPYKLELLGDLENPIIYRTGDFTDLCEGPHIKNTSEINPDAFKLTKIAGAYWKGDEKNKMLTRIYGVAFEKKNDLDEYLKMLEETKKRDHRKIGKEMDLFVFSDLVGPGLPLFTPKGVVIKDELQKHIEKVCRGYGFQKVSTPHLAKIELFEISGHAQKFAGELFHVKSHYKQQYVLKPVQCPHQTQIYASRPRSYRDLPIRYMESEKQYRDEKPGQISGLQRVLAITVEDGHSFCRVGQVKEEVKNMIKIIRDFYTGLGLWGKHWVSLSVRDYKRPENYIGDPKDWDICEKMLTDICEEMNLGAKKREGEAALYGPKIDFMFEDNLGREIQIPTVQLDFATPKKFGLTYTNEKGESEPPVMVHRAILGSYERFMMLLIEHFAGAFPLWLAPVQVKVLPISDKHKKYAQEIYKKLFERDFRVEIDLDDESLGKKIRRAKLEKIPHLLILGDKEMESQNITVENRDAGNLGQFSLDDLIEKIGQEIKNKK